MIEVSTLDAICLVAALTVAFDNIRFHNVVILAVESRTHTM